MPKINVLPGAVSELIAAGEVIERPASIVKELVENSIDAGAAMITVELQNGGVRYLRITDNGCGISREDAATSFLRHATSKVRSADDLDSIGTLGFRGEALASIAAVAHVEMLTRTPDSEFGTSVRVSASEVESVTEAGCPVGTTIVVRDVFYNVPARLKFLKRDVSEANAVQNILEKVALSHPEISFKFIRDGRTAFHTPGDGRLESVIYTIFGKEFSQNLLPVEYEMGGVRVSGYIGKPMYSRSNRSMQHFFVNGRYTRTKTGVAALEEGFRSSIMIGKFPACVLMLTMPYNLVDVNVHPAKIEVRFVSEKSVFDVIYFGVKSAIVAGTEVAPLEPPRQVGNMLGGFQPEESVQEVIPVSGHSAVSAPTISVPAAAEPVRPEPVSFSGAASVPCQSAPAVQEIKQVFPEPAENMEFQPVTAADIERIAPVQPGSMDTGPSEEPARQEIPEQTVYAQPEPSPVRQYRIRIIGELFATYILAQIDDTFALVDKHAAHERVLYNRLKQARDGLDKQYLLTSETVTLSRAEHEAVLSNSKLLEKMGFVLDDFGGNAVVMRAVPAVVAHAGPKEMLLDIADGLVTMKKQPMPEIVENILRRMACRSAVKAHDRNQPEEFLQLVETICRDENVRFCPHGRPVMIQLKQSDIEKMFGRIQ